jgi:excisionase family DNA binding protein
MRCVYDHRTFFTVSQAAYVLGVSEAFVRELLERGELNGIRLWPLRWLWLIPQDDVRRWRTTHLS